MTADPDNIVLLCLPRLDEKIDRLDGPLNDLIAGPRGLKRFGAGFMQSRIAQYNALATRQARMDRVERRLDLTEDAT